MKRRLVASMLVACMGISVLVGGCGDSKKSEPVSTEVSVNQVNTEEISVVSESTEMLDSEIDENSVVDESTEMLDSNDTTETSDLETGETLGNSLKAEFESLASSDGTTESIANALSSSSSLSEMSMVVEPVTEGYLSGFDNDITGFTEGHMFAPMISTIPFVGYVLKTDDADALISTLESNANKAWNICTEADEMVTAQSGDYVFFVMCRNSKE